MAIQTAKNTSHKVWLKWLISIMLPLGVMMIPTNESFTPEIKMFLGLTLWAVLAWAMELMDTLIPALALPVLYVLVDLAPTKVVFSSWASTVPWLVLGGMLICKVFEETGLMKRVAYWCVIKAGCSYRGIMVGLTLSGLILSTLIPTLAGRATLYAGLTYGLCKALKLEPKSNMASALMISGYFAATNAAYIVNTGSNIMVGALAQLPEGVTVSFSEYLLHNTIPVTILSIFMAWGLSIVLKPERQLEGEEYFVDQYKNLGKLSIAEKKVAVLLVVLVILLMTSTIHGIDPAWIFLLGALVCFLPIVNIAETSLVTKVNYSMVVFITATLSIGNVSTAVGASQFVADLLAPVMTIGGSTYTVVAVFIAGFLANFILTPLAAASSLMAPMIDIGMSVGLDPLVIVYAFVQGLEQCIFPYEIAPAVMTVAYGMIAMNKFIRVFVIKTVATLLLVFILFIPYWNIIGLL